MPRNPQNSAVSDKEPVDLPHTAYELIEYLDRMIPPRCIGLRESLEDAHRYAGQRALVEVLVEAMKAEQEATLEQAVEGGTVRRRQ